MLWLLGTILFQLRQLRNRVEKGFLAPRRGSRVGREGYRQRNPGQMKKLTLFHSDTHNE